MRNVTDIASWTVLSGSYHKICKQLNIYTVDYIPLTIIKPMKRHINSIKEQELQIIYNVSTAEPSSLKTNFKWSRRVHTVKLTKPCPYNVTCSPLKILNKNCTARNRNDTVEYIRSTCYIIHVTYARTECTQRRLKGSKNMNK
uniref:Uncharacterized protein n=1 Tax=Glossina palpalis gambiensis TaxID=67801 RepID=A0A1B0BFZ8_9MUSC